MGAMRTCDVSIPGSEVPLELLDFTFHHDLGILLHLRRGMTCVVDGEEIDDHSRPEDYPLRHGSLLQVGDVTLKVRLYEGVLHGGSARLMDDENDGVDDDKSDTLSETNQEDNEKGNDIGF